MNQDEYFKKLAKQFLNYTLDDADLSNTLKLYLNYYSLTKSVCDNKIYWFNFSENLENIIITFLKQLYNEFYESNYEYYYFLSVKANEYENKINKIENELLNKEIEPFYGDEIYIKHRIIYSTSKILSIISNDSIPDDIKEKFNNVYNILKNYVSDLDYLNMIGDFESQKKVYDILESYYKQLLIFEDTFSLYLEDIWNKKLSSSSMCGLAHGFSKGEFMPWEAKKVCTTYFDENYITIYGEYGYLYPMNMEMCDIICSTDASSYFIDKKNFIKDIKTWWQGCKWWQACDELKNFYKPAIPYKNNNAMFYAQPNNSKFALFDDVLKENYNLALKNNLIIEKNLPFGFGYNEIVFFDENKNIKPIGVWVKKGSDDVCIKAKKLADKLNLPLTVIDIQKCKSEYQNKQK